MTVPPQQYDRVYIKDIPDGCQVETRSQCRDCPLTDAEQIIQCIDSVRDTQPDLDGEFQIRVCPKCQPQNFSILDDGTSLTVKISLDNYISTKRLPWHQRRTCALIETASTLMTLEHYPIPIADTEVEVLECKQHPDIQGQRCTVKGTKDRTLTLSTEAFAEFKCGEVLVLLEQLPITYTCTGSWSYQLPYSNQYEHIMSANFVASCAAKISDGSFLPHEGPLFHRNEEATYDLRTNFQITQMPDPIYLVVEMSRMKCDTRDVRHLTEPPTTLAGFSGVVSFSSCLEATSVIATAARSASVPFVDTGIRGSAGWIQCTVPHKSEFETTCNLPLQFEPPACVMEQPPKLYSHCVIWAVGVLNELFVDRVEALRKASTFMDAHSIAVNCGSPKLVNDLLSRGVPQSWTDCYSLAVHTFQTLFDISSLKGCTPRKKSKIGSNVDISSVVSKEFIKELSNLLDISFKLRRRPASRLGGGDSGYWPQLQPAASGEVEGRSSASRSDLQSRVPVSDTRESGEDDDSGYDVDDEAILEQFLVANPGIIECLSHITLVGFADFSDKAEKIWGRLLKLTADLRATAFGVLIPDVTLEEVYLLSQNKCACDPYLERFIQAAAAREIRAEEPLNYFCDFQRGIVEHYRPAPPGVTSLPSGNTFTAWTIKEFQLNSETILLSLVSYLEEYAGLEICFICSGRKAVYMPYIPAHSKRLTQPLLALAPDLGELSVGFNPVSYDLDDISGPVISLVQCT